MALPFSLASIACNCYASANIKALETLGYAEHICNYVVILDSWFYGKSTRINVKKKLLFFETTLPHSDPGRFFETVLDQAKQSQSQILEVQRYKW